MVFGQMANEVWPNGKWQMANGKYKRLWNTTTMYVNKDGTVRKKYVSPCEWMRRFFESCLGLPQKKPEPFKTFSPACPPSG